MSVKTSAVSTALTMNVDDLQKGVAAASNSLKKLGRTAKDIQDSTKKLVLFEQLRLGVSAARGAISSLSGLVRSASDFVTVNTDIIRQQITLADALSISQDQFVGLGQAAANAGIEASQLFEPLSKIGPLVQRAVEGNKDALAVFDQLGLSAERLAKLTAFEQFGAFADAINDIRDANKQALILTKIAGESGLRFREFFAAGSEGFKQLTEESRKLGLGIGEAGVKSIKILDEAIRSANDAVQGLKNLILIDLAPELTAALRGLAERLKVPQFREQLKNFFVDIGKLALEVARQAADFLISVAENLATVVEKLKMLTSIGDPNTQRDALTWFLTPKSMQLTDEQKALFTGVPQPQAAEGNADPAAPQRQLLDSMKGIFAEIQAAAAEAVEPLKAKPAAADNQAQAAVKVQEKNIVAVKELTRATQQNTQQLRGLADGDDIRTASGLNTLLSVEADNFGRAKQVRLLEKIVEKLEKANQNKPAPVNI